MTEEEKKRRREELKGKLLNAFNRVSGDKIVNVSEFVKNFEREDDKYFLTAPFWNPARIKQGIAESIAEGEMRKLAKSAPPVDDGVYTATERGKQQVFVSADFMKRRLIGAIDAGYADEHMPEVEQAGYSTVDAIAKSGDNAERARTGALRPTKPKPPSG